MLPVYADKNFIDNTFTMSKYISFTESVVIANKYYLSGIEGLNDEDAIKQEERFKALEECEFWQDLSRRW